MFLSVHLFLILMTRKIERLETVITFSSFVSDTRVISTEAEAQLTFSSFVSDTPSLNYIIMIVYYAETFSSFVSDTIRN